MAVPPGEMARVFAERLVGPANTRRAWLDQLKGEALAFLKGDNNAPWAILAETVIGCVPVLGQIVDARDILRGLVAVGREPTSSGAWFLLITALIGLVPGGGDFVKRTMRAIRARVLPVDNLLAALQRFGKGNAERALRELLDLGKLQKYLDDILGSPRFLNRLSPQMRQQVDSIQRNLAQQFGVFKREIDGWLRRGPRSSADVPAGRATPNTPQRMPETRAEVGTRRRADDGGRSFPNASNPAQIMRRALEGAGTKALGILGEHMADYHCQEIKGWGRPAQHDEGAVNPAKLNDRGRLVQLWPPMPRGRGIDAVWESGGRKPYAIIEAKCSYDPTKSLGALLRDLRDKTGADANAGGGGRRGGGGGRSGGRNASSGKDTSKTPMSDAWIRLRLQQAVGSRNFAQRIQMSGYSRHVLFFSVPHALAHARAVIFHNDGRAVDPAMHATHEVTREWGDNQIASLVDRRQGITGPARRGRGRR